MGRICLAACGGLAFLLALAAPAPAAYDAPDPGGSATTPVKVPPPTGKFFGFHDESSFLGTHGWTTSEMANIAAGAGANLFRFTIDWHNVEPSMDRWDENWWRKYVGLHNALVTRGIKPLITLGGVPPWARPSVGQGCGVQRGCEYPPASWATGQWQAFAAEVARRLPYTAAIEPWNEPNLRGFYKPFPQPARWAQLVRNVYLGVKSVNPGIKVLAGGLAPTVTPEYVFGQLDKMPLKEFLQKAYTATPSIKGHIDGFSFHVVYPSPDTGAGSIFAKAFYDVRTVRNNRGDGHLPLWLTEAGMSTTGSAGLTEAQQGQGLLAVYRRTMTMPDVKGMVIHTLAEDRSVPATDNRRGQGVISSVDPFMPKLAYCAFAGRINTPTPFGGCPRIIETYPATGIEVPGDPIGGDPGGEDPGGEDPGGEDPGGPDPGDPGDPGGEPTTQASCGSRLTELTERVVTTTGAEHRAANRKYRRAERRCVPCKRTTARLKRKLRRSDGARPALQAKLARVRRNCAPCVKRLRSLQVASLDATPAEGAAYLQEHERARVGCTARMRRG